MTTQNPTVETTATDEGSTEPRKFSLKPLVKKTLIWGGAAVGLIAVGFIAASTRRTAEALEGDAIVIEELPNGTAVEAPEETETVTD